MQFANLVALRKLVAGVPPVLPFPVDKLGGEPLDAGITCPRRTEPHDVSLDIGAAVQGSIVIQDDFLRLTPGAATFSGDIDAGNAIGDLFLRGDAYVRRKEEIQGI